jgi:hypothetical protein
MPAPPPRLLCLLLALAASACVHARPPGGVEFAGPGHLLLILEQDGGRRLVVYDASGARQVPVEQPREARFIDSDTLLVVAEVASAEEYGLPATRLLVHQIASGRSQPLGSPGRHYDAEPSPDGAWLAVGADVAGVGDSDLEIWSIARRERLAVRHQSLEEPRWRQDGRALVVGLLMADPEEDSASGGGFGGSSFTWPRLHRLRRDLGRPELIPDGAAAGTLADGGSLPLWWDTRGIFARQRRGLVRCDPEAGRCDLVYATEPTRRVVDARPVGAREAWLLSVEAADAFDRRLPDAIERIDTETGGRLAVLRLPAGVFAIEIDWTP